ncbi:pyrroline-5-carboxylate reductase [Stenotrophomonas mori]|uniref:Pyrroline-5-carboxylate reductase n=1 Tax=Stenotrophomonas mori TaxID=2871096 RepID=A0ABT0SD97_9GAMM|nr:pyrroline-5-carboxylate reductase [Stenotrophomonas mori]MCL7713297.1 pyrroline-5-carboxylate reductase [Stenotrophomonas mori]
MSRAHDTPAFPSGIAFIGGGNMARSLIAGLVEGGMDPAAIEVVEPQAAPREALRSTYGVRVAATVAEAALGADALLLAVKPQVMAAVCADLAPRLGPGTLAVSIAAGVTTAHLRGWLPQAALVRAMPNTPALLGAGMTGLYAGADVDHGRRQAAQAILATAGQTRWIDDETLMDAVTAVSGSGPAYVFALAEAMEAAARTQGLDAEAARQMVVQTVLGAARMLAESGQSAGALREAVTSPNGTTQAALETLAAGGFQALVGTAVAAAAQRGRELAQNA